MYIPLTNSSNSSVNWNIPVSLDLPYNSNFPGSYNLPVSIDLPDQSDNLPVSATITQLGFYYSLPAAWQAEIDMFVMMWGLTFLRKFIEADIELKKSKLRLLRSVLNKSVGKIFGITYTFNSIKRFIPTYRDPKTVPVSIFIEGYNQEIETIDGFFNSIDNKIYEGIKSQCFHDNETQFLNYTSNSIHFQNEIVLTNGEVYDLDKIDELGDELNDDEKINLFQRTGKFDDILDYSILLYYNDTSGTYYADFRSRSNVDSIEYSTESKPLSSYIDALL